MSGKPLTGPLSLEDLKGVPSLGANQPMSVVLDEGQTFTDADFPDLPNASDKVKDAPPGRVVKPDTSEAKNIAATGTESSRAATAGPSPLYRFAETDTLPTGPKSAVVGRGIEYERVGGPGMVAKDVELSENSANIVAKRGKTEEEFHAAAQAVRHEANMAAEAAMAGLKERRDEQQAELAKKQAEIEREADRIAKEKVSTGEFWSNPGNIVSSLVLAISPAFSRNMAGGKGMTLANQALERDLEIQKFNINASKSALEAKRNSLKDFRDLMGSADAGDILYMAKSRELAANKLEEMGDKFASQDARDKAALQANALRQDMQKDMEKLNMVLYRDAQLVDQRLAPHVGVRSKDLPSALSFENERNKRAGLAVSGAGAPGTPTADSQSGPDQRLTPEETGQPITSGSGSVGGRGGGAFSMGATTNPEPGPSPTGTGRVDRETLSKAIAAAGGSRGKSNAKDIAASVSLASKPIPFKSQADMMGAARNSFMAAAADEDAKESARSNTDRKYPGSDKFVAQQGDENERIARAMSGAPKGVPLNKLPPAIKNKYNAILATWVTEDRKDIAAATTGLEPQLNLIHKTGTVQNLFNRIDKELGGDADKFNEIYRSSAITSYQDFLNKWEKGHSGDQTKDAPTRAKWQLFHEYRQAVRDVTMEAGHKYMGGSLTATEVGPKQNTILSEDMPYLQQKAVIKSMASGAYNTVHKTIDNKLHPRARAQWIYDNPGLAAGEYGNRLGSDSPVVVRK